MRKSTSAARSAVGHAVAPVRRPRARPRSAGPANASVAEVCQVACIDPPKVERVRRDMKAPQAVDDLAQTFKLLGDPTRLRIVHALSREELCVCDLAAVLGMSQSVTSHSLRALRQLRLVRLRREGKIAFYSLDDAHIQSLVVKGFRHVEEKR